MDDIPIISYGEPESDFTLQSDSEARRPKREAAVNIDWQAEFDARRLKKRQTSEKDSRLSSELIACRERSNFHDPEQQYFPIGRVRELVSPNTIEAEFKRCNEAVQQLRKCGKEDKEALINDISRHAYKTFATAVYSGLEKVALLDFMFYFLRRQKLTDKDLPTVSEKVIQDCCGDEEEVKAHTFCIYRWKFLAPVFSALRYDYDLANDCIFPFNKDATMSRSGAFGTVSRVQIHKDHLKHLQMQYVAVKELQIPVDEEKHALDKAWNDEAKALRNINTLRHPNVTKCIAAVRRGERRYFMFAWAEGGNLQEYWKRFAKRSPNAAAIRQMIEQLRGIADALAALHNSKGDNDNKDDKNLLAVPTSGNVDGDKSIRHGDLKPENILRFLSAPDTTLLHTEEELGILKIADMGRAKQHMVATQLRTNTSQRYGTIRYEAPEAITETKGRSRLYDVWSLGCITLEFIIWILYGNETLEEFYAQLELGRKQSCQYFELSEDRTRAEVHHTVINWMDSIHRCDPECSQTTAIKDLLHVVRNRLLIIELEQKTSDRKDLLSSARLTNQTSPIYRATAAEFREHLDTILKQGNAKSDYFSTGRSREDVRLPKRTDFLSPTSALLHDFPSTDSDSQYSSSERSFVVPPRPSRQYSLPPLKDWEFPVDNAFAERYYTQVHNRVLFHLHRDPDILCHRCSNLNFWAGGFNFAVQLSSLSRSAATCALCRLLEVACKRDGIVAGDHIQVERSQSNLRLSNADRPILSILRSPELIIPTTIQIGLPILPEPCSKDFFELIKLWLRDCDTQHTDCRPMTRARTHPDDPREFPTRLIDVGTAEISQLRLLETREERPASHEYLALSHPWGDVNTYDPFSTWRKDESGQGHDIETFKSSIPYDRLPATFKDAVICTRALGVRYLWIDSICIIQGEDGDFNEEAKNMEGVFSSAYCVIAASRATKQHDGFLAPRPQRDFITLEGAGSKPYYVCDAIDNFSKDVIEGSLNQRGWVLQERALARRTIYFTENQTYFECGNGIRCETLASMHNTMADFIGDPRFPEKAMRANSRALQIAYYQDLYKSYSRLQFSRDEDRPFAIAGLEKRLREAFGTKGGFGIFDDGDKRERGLFHRSLLWRHGDEEEFQNGLKSIDFSRRDFYVPSWSWMAYKGGIDYTTPEGGTAEWEMNDITEPWTRGSGDNSGSATISAPQTGVVAINATVRNFRVANRRPDEVRLFYDTKRVKGSDGQRAQCVIIAKNKTGRSDNAKRYYVMLVAVKVADNGRGRRVYQRIGAGYMLGKHIDFKEPGVEVEIQ